MGALANAERPRKEAPRPAKAYADPEAEQPAYAYPGYQQPTAKRLAKRAAPVDYYYDVYMEPRRAYIEPAKAYTNPLRRLAKRAIQPKVAKTNDYDYFDGDDAAYPEYRNGPTAERLAKAYGYPVAAGLGGYEAPPVQAPEQERLAKGAAPVEIINDDDADDYE